MTSVNARTSMTIIRSKVAGSFFKWQLDAKRHRLYFGPWDSLAWDSSALNGVRISFPS